MSSRTARRIAGAFVACAPLFTAIKCDNQPVPPPETEQSTAAELTAKPLDIGASFKATLEEEAVIPRFLAKQKAKRTGQVRAVDTTTSIKTSFSAELLAKDPESWRIEFASFERTSQTEGAPAATSNHELPGTAYMVEFKPEGPVVTLDIPAAEGEEVVITDSQKNVVTAVGEVLRERHAWQKFIPTRPFEQGKIVAGPEAVLVGQFASELFGPLSQPHATVSFFRFGADAAENEIAIFEVHQNFRATQPDVEDGSYMDFESNGRVRLRMEDAFLLGYDISAKTTPRAQTGNMLPEGSGKWSMSFEIDPNSLRTP